MKVLMVPHLTQLNGEGGINTVIRKYFEHAPDFGIEFVDPHKTSFDVLAVHAGMSREFTPGTPTVSHLHGLYWSEDVPADPWQFKANRDIVESLRHANQVTVPSEWVAKTLQRDMRLLPHVLPHGIDYKEWVHTEPNEGYVLWNKNRRYDVCDPQPVGELANRFANVQFQSTFAPKGDFANVKTIGLLPHMDMRRTIQRAGVYLATTKETFGIGTLEALAAGVPVLGFKQGGTASLVHHGLTGYLAQPNNYEDLSLGLSYCLANRATLGRNAQKLVRQYDWEHVVEQLYSIYEASNTPKVTKTAVIVPCFNYGHVLERCVDSVMKQTKLPDLIVIVDNNSTDNTKQVALMLEDKYATVIRYVNCAEQGVAHARNLGISLAESATYICCLDADDEIKPYFLETCFTELHANPTLGLVYTRMEVVNTDGQRTVSQWPGEYNYDAFTKGQNQVPTCCLFRRDLWERLGGYRQRYAPHGAGAEDADFWLRMGSVGFGGKLATEQPLFVYHLGGQVSGNPAYREVNYRKFHPWTLDRRHPFASVATPVNALSHPVRQYDTPTISVVIPCAKAHFSLVVDALDSLEGQTFRQWEIILVCDGFEPPDDALHEAYPFVQIVACTKRGAGAARNLGAEKAVGQHLLFLDADDWLEPDTLERLLAVARTNNAIAYSDYNGHAIIDDQAYLLRLQEERRLIAYDELTHKTVIAHRAFDYDCVKAQRQPELDANGEFYIWCLISALIPRQWHVEVGGFDETMESWEDFEYWVKLARKGKCFVRVAERLLNYRFYTGERRELASPATASTRQRARNLIQYLHEKFSGEKPMGCGNCGKPTEVRTTMPQAMMDLAPRFSVDETVEVQLIDGNIGDHGITGNATGQFYGNKRSGDTFLMSRRDADMMPRAFRILGTAHVQEEVEEEASPPLALPVELFDFTELPDVTAEHALKLSGMGVRTLNGLLLADQEELKEIFPARTLKRVLAKAYELAA